MIDSCRVNLCSIARSLLCRCRFQMMSPYCQHLHRSILVLFLFSGRTWRRLAHDIYSLWLFLISLSDRGIEICIFRAPIFRSLYDLVKNSGAALQVAIFCREQKPHISLLLLLTAMTVCRRNRQKGKLLAQV